MCVCVRVRPHLCSCVFVRVCSPCVVVVVWCRSARPFGRPSGAHGVSYVLPVDARWSRGVSFGLRRFRTKRPPKGRVGPTHDQRHQPTTTPTHERDRTEPHVRVRSDTCLTRVARVECTPTASLATAIATRFQSSSARRRRHESSSWDCSLERCSHGCSVRERSDGGRGDGSSAMAPNRSVHRAWSVRRSMASGTAPHRSVGHVLSVPRCSSSPPAGKKEVRVLILGLDNAGKTTILYKLYAPDR